MNNKCFRSNFNFKGKKMERYFRCVHNLKHGVNAILYKVKDPILPSVCIYIYRSETLCLLSPFYIRYYPANLLLRIMARF